MVNKGVGVWKCGMIITRTIASFLTLENCLYNPQKNWNYNSRAYDMDFMQKTAISHPLQ